jgi:MipA family protein
MRARQRNGDYKFTTIGGQSEVDWRAPLAYDVGIGFPFAHRCHRFVGSFYSHVLPELLRAPVYAGPQNGLIAWQGKISANRTPQHLSMKKLLALTLVVACDAAWAETPAPNAMPDGSRDMYIGLGVVAAPDYLGAREMRSALLPLLQVEWSNGVFVSGMSAGVHLSRRQDVEFGPLLAIDSGRDLDGQPRVGGVIPFDGVSTGGAVPPGGAVPSGGWVPQGTPAQGLQGMPDVRARLQGGAFANYYLAPSLRLASSVLYGAGNERDGAVWNIGLQRMWTGLPHHRVSVSAGVNLVNRRYNAGFFGVSLEQAMHSGHPAYAPGGGLRDVYVGAAWNWALSPSWMIASAARLTRLSGDARHSPLVERPSNVTVSSGLVYRF